MRGDLHDLLLLLVLGVGGVLLQQVDHGSGPIFTGNVEGRLPILVLLLQQAPYLAPHLLLIVLLNRLHSPCLRDLPQTAKCILVKPGVKLLREESIHRIDVHHYAGREDEIGILELVQQLFQGW